MVSTLLEILRRDPALPVTPHFFGAVSTLLEILQAAVPKRA